jgi:hypothetical protein
MFQRVAVATALMACLGTPLHAAGGSAADGAVTVSYATTHWGASPLADFLGTETLPALDALYQSGWWYRIDGVDTRERPMAAPTTESYDNATGTISVSWANLNGTGLEVREFTYVIDNEGPSGTFISSLSATNTTGVPITVSAFHYLDLDAGGTFGGDTASLQGQNFLTFTDTTGSVVRYRAPRASGYRVSSFGAGGVLDALNDTALTTLSNTGLPFGPGDAAAAFQFPSLTIPPGGTYSLGEVTVSSRLLRNAVKGDFCQSGYPTVLFLQATQGYPVTWCMRRTRVIYSATYGVPLGDRRVVADDDFDGNFLPDFVERDTVSGDVFINGGPIAGAPTLPLNWQLSATGDFNADGKPDIVWRNTTSQKVVIWTMNGNLKTGSIIPNPDQAVDANWEIAAALDFNADGNTDFLWYNGTSGKIVIWTMNAAVQRTAGAFTTPSNAGNNNWRVVAGGDFGKGPATEGTPVLGSQDILWRNQTSGKLVVWHMNLSGVRTSGTFTDPDGLGTAFTVVGPR